MNVAMYGLSLSMRDSILYTIYAVNDVHNVQNKKRYNNRSCFVYVCVFLCTLDTARHSRLEITVHNRNKVKNQ